MVFKAVQAEKLNGLKLQLVEKRKKILGLLRKRVRFLSIVSFLAILLVVTLFSVWNARPGDLMFFPHLLAEEITLPLDTDNKSTNFTNSLIILRHRITSYRSLAMQGECVKLLLAEKELEKSLQLSLSKLDSPAYSLGAIYTLLQQLDNASEGRCQKSPLVSVYDWIISAKLAQAAGSEEFIAKEIESRSAEIRSRYEQIRQDLQRALINSQDVLNRVNDLLLFTGQILLLSEQPVANGFSAILDLRAAEYALVRASELLTNEARLDNVPWQYEIIAICRLAPSADECAEATLAAKWNSIAAQGQERRRLMLATDICKSYLELF